MVHITQCLCGPQRHCIIGIYWAEPEFQPEEAEAAVKLIVDHLVETHQINPWCGICASRDFRYEDARSRFSTMEEAGPEVQRAQLGNILAQLQLTPERQ